MDSLKKKLFQSFIIVYLAFNLILSVSCPISGEWTISDEWTVSPDFAGAGPPPPGPAGDWIIYTNKLGIQQGYTRTGEKNWVLLTANTNMINSSTNTLVMSNTGQGYLTFVSNETFSMKIDYNFHRVQLTGDQGNTVHDVTNSSSHTVNSGNTIRVSWSMVVSPYIPLTFLFWIIGLFMCFIGPYMGIKKLKKGEHREGLILITTVCAVGFSLVLAGMFSA